jgi:parallel beta-helix repeat protein
VSARRSPRALVLPLVALAVLLAGCGSGDSATFSRALDARLLGPSVAASGSEATSAVAHCRVDGASWRECSSPFVAFDLAPGAHTIEIEAAHGGVGVLRRPADTTGDRLAVVAFANTGTGPARRTVSFTVAGAEAGGSIALATPPRGVLRGLVQVGAKVETGGSRTVLVDYYVDGNVVATAASAPWSALVDASRIPAGRHELRAVAVSLDRRRRASAATRIRVGTTHITTPQDAVRGALQAAVDALGSDGGTLRLPAGRFAISGLRLGSGVRLIGAGRGRTVLVAPQGSYDDALEVTGDDVLVSDLSVDARGAGPSSDESAAILIRNADDVVLRRLNLVHLKGYGVQVLGHHQRISVQQSTFSGDRRAQSGIAEWSEDASSSDVSVVRCVIRGFTKYGVLLQSFFNGKTWPHRRPLAYGNAVSDVHDPKIHDGTIEIGIWLAGADAAALDNLVRDAGWDGIETVVNASRPTISGNVVRDTMTGIYIENVTRDALIEQNDIAGVSVAGINLEPPHGGPQSGRLTVRANRVVGAGVYGIGSGPGTLGNRITGNIVLDSGKYGILLEGASGNVVEGNDLRDRRTPARQTWCVYDPQTRGTTTHNTVRGNDCSGSLNGGSSDAATFSARRGQTP